MSAGSAARTRMLAALGAAVTWVGLGLQLYLLVTGPLGVLGGAWRFIAFFTILMNLLAAFLFTRAAIAPEFTLTGARLQTASTLYMTTVGGVYVLLLQDQWDPKGLQLVADRLLHHAAPLVSVGFWFLCVPKADLEWSDSLRWAGVPLLYLGYIMGRAQLDGFYPYFFIDVAQVGMSRALMNAGGMLVAFVLLGLSFVAIGRLLGRR